MAPRRHRLAQRRKSLGFTQESLAGKLGVERSTVVRWESGDTGPQPWMRPRIAEALRISATQLDGLLAEADSSSGMEGVETTKRRAFVVGGLASLPLGLIGPAELETTVLACRAFHAAYGPGDEQLGLDLADAAVAAARHGACDTTGAWVAAVASERHADAGNASASHHRLDQARSVLSGPSDDRPWSGIGSFDLAKLTAYEGGNYRRLGDYGNAIRVLDTALTELDPSMRRHRTTALIDRAEAHHGAGHIDAACADTRAALALAADTQHVDTVHRAEKVARSLLATDTRDAHPVERRVGPEDDHGVDRLNGTAADGYRGLIVDFGGVLSTSFDGALRSFCVREGLEPDALEQVFSLDAGAKGMLVDLERGVVSQAEFVTHLAATLGVNPDGLLERMVADLHLEPEVAAAVQRLRQRGVRVAVLSNSWGSHPFDPYRPFDLPQRFDAVVISDQVGLRKPEPAIFTLAADRLRLPPSACVFVDDVARYLPPAEELGMGTVHATDPETTLTELARLFPRVDAASS